MTANRKHQGRSDPASPARPPAAERYRELFDAIDQAFAIVEVLVDEESQPVDYRFLETNRAYLRHTALENVVGKTGRELVPDLEGFWVETFGRVARTGDAERFLHPAHGIDRWFDCYAFRFGDPAARQVAVFFHDATERRIAEQRDRFLVALEDATRNLVSPEEIAATATRLLGEHLRADRVVYTEVEENGEEATVIGGWAAAAVPSLRGRYRFRAFGHEHGRDLRAGRAHVLEDVARAELADEEQRRYQELRVAAIVHVPLHKAGRLSSSLAVHQSSPRHWREPEIELVRNVASRCWEAIERARAAARSRDSEEQFRTLASLLPQFIWAARPDGHIYWFNDYAHEFFGASAAIEGLGWMRYHDPDLLPEIERGYLEAIAAGEPYACTTRFRNAAGAWHWFAAGMLPQRDPQGRVLRFIGYNFDVTDLYETQARLVEADRRKDEFLATLAHELRNPLAPLDNILEILKLNPGQEITADLRAAMHRQVHHLGRLVEDLLDASRITRGVVELQRERVSIAEAVGAAIETSRPQIESGGHRLRIDAPAEPLWVDADPVRLTQVLANLLNNAAKYTDADGSIGIRLRSEAGFAVVTVTDDGIGIAPEMIDRVFDLFTQVDRRSGRGQGGLGIGLALSRSLVEMHGGTLEAASEGIGRGSRFTVRLPLAAVGSPSAADVAPVESTPPSNAAKLLVVDDNADAAESLALLLRMLGAEVDVVYDGAAALARLAQALYAVAFVDLGMPGLDGLEVARRIRADGRVAGMLLVAVTGWDQDEDRARSRAAGFDHHLVKPAGVDELEGVLRMLPMRAPGTSP